MLRAVSFRNLVSRREDGTAIIEFTVAFPVFLLFFLFVVEYGLMMFGNAIIRNVVEQAAHLSAIGCKDAEFTPGEDTTCGTAYRYDEAKLRSEVVDRSYGFVKGTDTTLFTVNVGSLTNYATSNCLGQGGEVRVFQVTYRWPVFFGYLRNFNLFGQTMDFRTVTVVRNEPFGTITGRCS